MPGIATAESRSARPDPSSRESDCPFRNAAGSNAGRDSAHRDADVGPIPCRQGPEIDARSCTGLRGIETVPDPGHQWRLVSRDDLTLEQALTRLMDDLDAGGLEILSRFKVGNLARPRRYEVAMAINRMRTLSVQA